MAALLIILPVTVGLALRVGVHSSSSSPADSERAPGTDLMDACVRTFIIVLVALIGLLALGMMYGNVLGSVNATP